MRRYLNLYPGVGGNRKLVEGYQVTAVELNPEIAEVYSELYPDDEVIVDDAHDFLIKHYKEFDFVWGSPPCPSHSKMMKATRHDVAKYPDMKLYEEIIFLQHFFKGMWVIENVKPYYEPLIKPRVTLGRHLFWSNFHIPPFHIEQPKGFINKSNLQGKKEMMDWLDIHFEKNIYIGNNHCPVQVLRNCVHPKLGLHILNNAERAWKSNNVIQEVLFR